MLNSLEKCQHILEKIDEPNRCKYCDKIFSSDKKKRRHIHQIHRVHRNLCFECGKSFDSEQKLATHERVFHSETELDKPKNWTL